MFSGEYCEILRNSFFYKTSLVAVSETGRKSPDDNKLMANSNLRYGQQQRTTSNCHYERIRQQKNKK